MKKELEREQLLTSKSYPILDLQYPELFNSDIMKLRKCELDTFMKDLEPPCMKAVYL